MDIIQFTLFTAFKVHVAMRTGITPFYLVTDADLAFTKNTVHNLSTS